MALSIHICAIEDTSLGGGKPPFTIPSTVMSGVFNMMSLVN